VIPFFVITWGTLRVVDHAMFYIQFYILLSIIVRGYAPMTSCKAFVRYAQIDSYLALPMPGVSSGFHLASRPAPPRRQIKPLRIHLGLKSTTPPDSQGRIFSRRFHYDEFPSVSPHLFISRKKKRTRVFTAGNYFRLRRDFMFVGSRPLLNAFVGTHMS
jgi:hypothetical protein